jgi:hypothetical protein
VPFVPVSNTALVEARVLVNAQQCENTLWFKSPSAFTATSLGTLGIMVRDWHVTNYLPLVSSALTLVEVVSTDQTAADGLQDVTIPDPGSVGGASPNVMPNNVTLTVSFRTGHRGRSFRGRNYVNGLTEDQVDGNSFVAGLTDLWQGVYEALIGAASDIGMEWVVASRFSGVDPVTHDPIPRVAGVTTPITSVLVVDPFVDSARRRLTGRGR